MRAYISGWSGFVGRHFKKTLQERGWDVDGCDIKEGDDCRVFFVRDSDVHYDLVIHCAAIIDSIDKRVVNPMDLATNIELDMRALQWAVRHKPEHFVYFSSSAVYPVRLQERATEMSRQGPQLLKESHAHFGEPDAMYGLTKLVGEKVARYARQAGLNLHVVRPFSGYGEDQDLSYPFPSLIRRIKNKENPIEVWGDGSTVRDWIHIDDIVGAVLEMVAVNHPGPVNLGIGVPVSFDELIMKMMEISGHQAEIRYLTDKPVGCWYRCAVTHEMRKFYEPTVTLETGIARALRTP